MNSILELRKALPPSVPSNAHNGALVVAEVAQSHDGSVGMAHAFIDAIAHAGADAVKFQTHIASSESTTREPWRVKFSQQDVTRFDYWKRMEFSETQWHELKRHADEKGLLFLSSPFSDDAVDLLERVGVPAWKVASGEITNLPMLDRMVATGKPIILSTGMSPYLEIDTAVERIRAGTKAFAVLQCTTKYPSPPDAIGLNVLGEFRERYRCNVGLSDHSGTIYPGLAAVALGAEVIEVHATFSKAMFGPDVSASLTLDDLKRLCEGVRFFEKMQSNPINKDDAAERAGDVRKLFFKSIVYRRDLPAGTRISAEDLAYKKPGTGLAPDRASEIIGGFLQRDVRGDDEATLRDVAK